MGLVEAFLEILAKPKPGEMVIDLMMFLGPVSIVFCLGIMVGWAWKPRWASLGNCKFVSSQPCTPNSSVALIPSPVKRAFGSAQSLDSFRVRTPSFGSCVDNGVDKEQFSFPSIDKHDSSSSNPQKGEDSVVMDEDFKYLCQLVERKDGGLPWKHIMDCSTANMSYQAWIREPETGPPQYCSRTVYENATPELMRDFYWDDEFRMKWDDMLLKAVTMEEFPNTGMMVVHWVRKFPFFCSDREYTIGRRIWESGRTYYCVTKGVPYPAVPRKQKPRRVDLYYSSWFIQSVASKNGSNLPACEVLFFHHEDMGIPREIAKFGVRQGMWGASQKVERGFRAYQKERALTESLSRSALMARTTTKVDPNYLESLESDESTTETSLIESQEKQNGINVPKLLVFGGAVLLAVSLDQGLLAKAVIFGVGRRFANIGRRACPRTM